MNESSDQNGIRKAGRHGLFFTIGAALLLAACIAGFLMIWNKPKAGRREAMRVVPVVEVTDIAPESRRVMIECAGTVIAADEMDVQPLVAGQILRVHPDLVEGGVVKAGEALAEIDPADYELQVAQHRAALAQAESALQLEKGQQAVAEREWALLGDKNTSRKDRELALRKPQLKAAQATVDSARSALSQAELNLDRAKVRAPANGVVAAVYADAGDRAVPGQPLVKLVNTDRYWVRALAAVDQIQWIDFPDAKSGRVRSMAEIAFSSGARREGSVTRLLPDLEEGSRMARFLLEIRDPLRLDAGSSQPEPILLGDYVRVSVTGREASNVLKMPLEALRDGAELWLIDETGRLHIQPAEVVWMGKQEVLVRNDLPKGWRLIVSDLSTPVDGMELRVLDSPPPAAQGEHP